MRVLAVAGVLVVLALAAVPAAQAYEQREESLTIGLFGSYEGIEGGGYFGDDFDLGPGFGVKLRYALSRQSAIGLVFERMTFDFVGAWDDTVQSPPDEFVSIVTGAEYTRFFDRRGKLGKSLSIGAGFYHPTVQISRNEQQTGQVTEDGVKPFGDNLLGWIGAGLEYFPRRTIGVELGVQGFGMLTDDGASGVAQASLGVNFYLLK